MEKAIELIKTRIYDIQEGRAVVLCKVELSDSKDHCYYCASVEMVSLERALKLLEDWEEIQREDE